MELTCVSRVLATCCLLNGQTVYPWTKRSWVSAAWGTSSGKVAEVLAPFALFIKGSTCTVAWHSVTSHRAQHASAGSCFSDSEGRQWGLYSYSIYFCTSCSQLHKHLTVCSVWLLGYFCFTDSWGDYIIKIWLPNNLWVCHNTTTVVSSINNNINVLLKITVGTLSKGQKHELKVIVWLPRGQHDVRPRVRVWQLGSPVAAVTFSCLASCSVTRSTTTSRRSRQEAKSR